jgi:hypothetical protein
MSAADDGVGPVYRVNVIGKNKTKTTIVFGLSSLPSSPNERIKHSNQRIHMDDTIEAIKRKILIELPSVSYDELYLFTSVHPFLTVERIKHFLTCGNRLSTISHGRLITLCQNLKSPDLAEELCESIQSSEKTDYTAEELSDFFQKVQGSDGLRMEVPLGQSLQYDYPMPADPIGEPLMDPELKKSHVVKTKNADVLLECGFMVDAQINVCCAEDALSANTGSTDAEIIKLYYPYLHEKGIVSREQLAERKQELLDETKGLVDAAFIQHNEAVDVMYRVHAERQNPAELRYIERGMKSVHFIMRPVMRFAMPLESLFKILHSTHHIPLIKYNPSGQREKVYRMYAPDTTKTGDHVPVLTKSKVMRLDGEIGKRRRVAAFMECDHDGFACEIVCEFDAEANVHVRANFRRAIAYGNADNDYDNPVNHVLRKCLNPLLREAREFLQSTSGNSIEQFCSIAVPTVEIVDIGYASYLADTPMIRTQHIMGCMSVVFTVVDETEGELSMRYKRVSNYDDQIGADAYIAERIRKDAATSSIVSGLVKNRLVKTEEAARQRVADYKAAEQVMEGAHRRVRTRVKQPGFLTVVRRENMELHIEISDITSVRYIRLLEMYLDAILRIAMCGKRKEELTTRVPMSVLDALCSKRTRRKVAEVGDLNAEVEQASEVPAFVADMSFEDRFAFERALEREAEGADNEGADNEGADREADVYDMMDAMMQGDSGGESEEEEEEKLIGGAPRKASAARASASAPSGSESEEESDSESEERGPGAAYAPQSLKNPNPFEYKLQKSEPILFLSKKSGDYDTYSTNCQSNIKRQPVVLSKQEFDDLNADPKYRDMLKDALEYGSDPDHKYYYMCPRYWSFKDRRPMTEQEVKDKNLERHVIGKKDKDVTLDKYIFEFNDYGKEHMGAKGYIPHYPGFLNTSVHPDGLCVPCCFKKQQKFGDLKVCEDKLRVAKQAPSGAPPPAVPSVAPPSAAPPSALQSVVPVAAPVAAPVVAVQKGTDDYIVGPDKFPIPMGRRGYLPQPVQRFLNYDNSTCQVSQTNKALKKNVPCLLRYGVQESEQDATGRPSRLSERQSFIACMAALRQDDRPKTITEMKRIILDGITLDSFLTYQNGTLTDVFKPAPGQGKEVRASESIYRNTRYVKKMMDKKSGATKERIEAAMSNTINAYENFRQFIESDDSVIDHTYMWDIFTTFNPAIFNTQQQRFEKAQEKGASKEQATRNIGFNLIILEIPKDDNSDALNIVCPSNHYSNNQFNANKPTVILIKQYNYYEPIYQFTDNDNAKKSDIKKSFSLKATELAQNLKVMIELIKNQIMPACAPQTVVKTYKFKYNISAEDAISILQREKFTVNRLVLNYDSKVIGVDVSKRDAGVEHSGIVMTAASPLDPKMTEIDMDLVMMDDPEIWQPYVETLQFLTYVKKETKSGIPCQPLYNVVDDGRLIGVLTETNQFVEIRDSMPYTDKKSIPVPAGMEAIKEAMKLIEYKTANPHKADAEVQTTDEQDAARVKYVQRIQLETKMYELFRNSMRIMVNKIKNMERKKRLEEVVYTDAATPYDQKIREIMRICREMGNSVIEFATMSDAVLDAFISNDEFKTESAQFIRCISAENRIEYGPNTCMRIVNPESPECKIVLPQNNLINRQLDNRTFYYGKLADELLRYTRIRRFILSQSSALTTLMPVNYDLREDEIILLYSQLEPYFDHLDPIAAGTMNRFARYNTFETANPQLNPGQVPSSNYVVEGRSPSPSPAPGPGRDVDAISGGVCVPVSTKPLTGAAAHYFPKTMKLIAFDDAIGNCTFGAFISIMKEESAEYADLDVDDLKRILVSNYVELMKTHKIQMMNYYKHLTANRSTLIASPQDFIMNSFHYMTHLDLWILAQHFRVPIALIASQIKHPLIENERAVLVLHGTSETDAFYYVSSSGRVRDVPISYGIVRTSDNRMKFSLNQCIDGAFVEQIQAQLAAGVVPVADFIAGYVPAVVKKRVGLKEAVAADAADA